MASKLLNFADQFGTDGYNWIPIKQDWSQPFSDKERPFYRDASVTLGPIGTNEVRLVITDDGLQGWGPGEVFDDPGAVLVLRFNAISGWLNGADALETSDNLPDYQNEGNLILPDPGADLYGGPAGIAWLADGNSFIMAGERVNDGGTGWTHDVGIYDISGGDWSDLTDQLDVQVPEDYFYSRFYPASGPDNGPTAVYVVGDGGLGAILDINGTPTWSSAIATSDPVTPATFAASEPNAYHEPKFINAQVVGDGHLDAYEDKDCCGTWTAYLGWDGYDFGSQTYVQWHADDNPFGNCGEVIMTGDLVVPAGVHLVLFDMTFRFEPTARLVIEPGGAVTAYNCIFMNGKCDPRWPGIRVGGTLAADQQPLIGGDQGYLRLSGCVVRNARTGVLAAKEPTLGVIDVNGFGGIVQCHNGTIFQNNIVGADVGHYNGNTNVYGVWDNVSFFNGTQFLTDDQWPDPPNVPQWHLVLQEEWGVGVNFCSFANDDPASFPENLRGNGVLCSAAQARILGNGEESETYFRNLHIGLLNTNYLNTAVEVDHMHFDNNVWGLADFGMLFGRYTNNTFRITDQGIGTQPHVGMLLWQSQLMTVERNFFYGETSDVQVGDNSVGIYFLGYNPALGPDNYGITWVYIENRIYDNSFADLQVANLVRWIHRGSNADGWKSPGLQMLCGDYTNNLFDHAILPESLIRPKQGDPYVDPVQLGGNRYEDQASCSGDFDWWFDPDWNNLAGWWPDLPVKYWRHEGPTAIVDPLCEYPDFTDEPSPGSGDLDVEVDCDGGILDDDSHMGELIIKMNNAKGQWEDAQASLDGLVGGLPERDLIAAIEESHPWATSSSLRNLVLASSPVSDLVLRAIITRREPMQAWHLTQVMLANVPLNRGVLNLLEESGLLSVFYWDQVREAQNGAAVSLKQQLEEEVAVRRLERTMAMTRLGWLYGSDTTLATGHDSLRELVLNTGDLDFTYQRLQLLVGEGDWTGLEMELEGTAGKMNGSQIFQGLLSTGHAVGGDWTALSPGEKEGLLAWEHDGAAGAPVAAGILRGVQYTDTMPVVVLPHLTRAAQVNEGAAQSARAVALGAYPNPANESTMITWPQCVKGKAWELRDLFGRAVARGVLNTNGVQELGLRALRSGTYQFVVPGTDEGVRIIVTH